MKTVHTSPAALYCPLPGHDPRCAYIPADRTNVAETIRRFAPIHVSSIRDDYENVLAADWLDMGGFRP